MNLNSSVTDVFSNVSFTIEGQQAAKDKTTDTQTITWSSRGKGLHAYILSTLSFTIVLKYTNSIIAHGSIIIIPHLIFEIAVGFSVCLTEILLGRYVTGSFVRIYNMCPMAKGILYSILIISCIAIGFKFHIMVYLFKYAITIFERRLLWEKCEKPWAKENCYSLTGNATYYFTCLKEFNESYCNEINWESSGTQYWKYVVLDDFNFIIFNLFTLLGFCITVFVINYRGIRSLEKAFILLMWIPICLSVILGMVAFTRPGFLSGMKTLWRFDWEELLDFNLWLSAFENTLLISNNGLFALSFISCHGNFYDDVLYDIFTVIFSHIFFGSFLIAPIVSVLKVYGNIPVKNYPDTINTFVSISEVFIYYPFPKYAWAFIFYLEMILFEIGSQTVLCLAVVEAFVELTENRVNIYYVSAGMAFLELSLSIMALFIEEALIYPFQFSIVTNVCFFLIVIQVVYGYKRFNDNFHFMMGYQPPFIFHCLEISSSVISVFFFGATIFMIPTFNESKQIEYIMQITIPITVFILSFCVQIILAYKKKNTLQAFKYNSSWGPSIPLLSKSRVVFNSKDITKEFMYRKELYKKPFMKSEDFSDQCAIHLV